MHENHAGLTPEATELYAELLRNRARGQGPDLDELCSRHPKHAHELHALESVVTSLRRAEHAAALETESPHDSPSDVAPTSVAATRLRSETVAPETGSMRALLRRLQAQGPRSTRYSMQGEVARGGMGAILRVWDNELRRMLAMKVVLGHEGTSSGTTPATDPKSLGRFLEEAQVTGQLEHPGIVPVHEMGLRQDGGVYFTMRLVAGDDLLAIYGKVRSGTEGWNPTRALNVLLKVCEALAYAHSRGVIHRDLKPANVMVGKFGEVYVMDWGLARVQGQPDRHDLRPRVRTDADTGTVSTARGAERGAGQESSLVTMDGDVMGTPVYMPPEQAAGKLDALGPWSDVYALGAMLYHLLSGQMPYSPEGTSRSPFEVLKAVLDGPPQRIETLAPRTPPELMAICEKAMAREPLQRYPDTQAMAEDLRAFLEQRVVAAYEAGPWAEARKWVRRNRAFAVALTAAALIALTGAIAFAIKADQATRSALEARDQAELARSNADEAQRNAEAAQTARTEAETQAELARQREQEALASLRRAERVTRLVETSLISADPNQGGAQQYLVVQAMDRAIAELERGGLASDPETEASLQLTIAGILNGNGRIDRALDLAMKALQTRQRLYPGDHLSVAAALHDVATCQQGLGHADLAVEGYRAALAMRRRLHAGDHPEVAQSLTGLGQSLEAAGRSSEAIPEHEVALEMFRRLHVGDHSNTATTMLNLAASLISLGDVREALVNQQAALEMYQRIAQGDDPNLATSLTNVGQGLHHLGRTAEALPKIEAALEMYQRMFQGDHPSVATALNNVGVCLRALGRHDEALAKLEAALEMRQRLYPGDNPEVAQGMNNVAAQLQFMGRLEESLIRLEAALAMRRRLFSADHPNVATSLNNVAGCLMSLNRFEDALPLLEQALEMTDRLLPGENSSKVKMLNNLGFCMLAMGRHELAREHFEAALEMLRLLGVDDRDDAAVCLAYSGVCSMLLGRGEQALPRMMEALEMRHRLYPAGHPELCESLRDIARCLVRLGRKDEALARAEQAGAMAERVLPEGHGVRKEIDDLLEQLEPAHAGAAESPPPVQKDR